MNTPSPTRSDSAAPTARSFSAGFEPLDLVERFPERYPALLESGAAAPSAGNEHFDILPIASGERLCLAAPGLTGPHAAGDGFLQALERWWRELRCPRHASMLPFTGGWLLYLGYELAQEIEPRLRLPPSSDPLLALAVRAPAAWVRDRRTGHACLVAEPGHEALLEQFEAHVARAQRKSLQAPATPVVHLEEEDAQRFLGAVSGALAYTAAGDVYQTNLSREWRGTMAEHRPTSIYRRLRAANPGPFAALLRHQDFAIASSSPERLVSVRNGVVATRPIAGTRPRGVTRTDDVLLIDSLLANEKERAEHVMLIDLERNDLGRICVGGSVRVDEYMAVESYAHVHHIVSNISGTLAGGVSPVGVIRALFPGGTITGCPKVRCMQIIAELEGTGRGAYTGSIGYLNRDGSLDLNILIRTIAVHAREVYFRAGAGIVADSIPLQELAETRAKAEGLLRALRVPG